MSTSDTTNAHAHTHTHTPLRIVQNKRLSLTETTQTWRRRGKWRGPGDAGGRPVRVLFWISFAVLPCSPPESVKSPYKSINEENISIWMGWPGSETAPRITKVLIIHKTSMWARLNLEEYVIINQKMGPVTDCYAWWWMNNKKATDAKSPFLNSRQIEYFCI